VFQRLVDCPRKWLHKQPRTNSHKWKWHSIVRNGSQRFAMEGIPGILLRPIHFYNG
jgi:hypothetical protein